MAYNNEKIAEEFEEQKRREIWIQLAVALGLTIIVAGSLDLLFQGVPLGFIIPLLNEPASLSTILYHASVIITGTYIGFIGLKELVFEKRFSIEFLMSIAALGAAYLDFLFEGATVLFLYSLSEYFEDYIQDRARKTVEKLSQFIPEKARVIVNGSEKSVEAKEVQPGMTILVKPGERIPLDGTVVDGVSSVDQSLVTGESIPILKKQNDNVYAGTLNLSGVLKVVVNKSAENTLVSRIVKLVVESRKRKASIEKLVDKFARVYVPIVISLAAFTAIFGPRIAGGPFETWLYRSLILLVVSCPSAFVISVPATTFTAVTIAARKGVIIKGGIYVEKMAKVKAVVFDKTGTLTLGTPVVHNIKANGEINPEVLTYAAALEQFSNHPIAKAIVKKAEEQGLPFNKLHVSDVEEIPGKGIIGNVNGAQVIIGNMDLMQQYSCNCKKIDAFYENEKHTFVCIAINKVGEASLCLIDDVRRDALEAMDALRKIGIHTAMLTGDKREIADEIAEKLGVKEVYAELFPEDKLKIVDRMKAKHGLVAMVGDGVNDALALAASDVSVAMRGSGVDVALETADIVLVKDELIQVPYLIKLSQKTVRIAKQNIAASLGVKILLGALGLMGFIPLWFTVAAGDDGVTMLVLLNTLRLTKVKL
ncbi:cadmium-translocating P-type ATPase [Candidatus Bathyarchaeota archaeon]|nr:cadmium-translocating P-type ATPase [Candidatus Bathyarchaeota archaeon]